MKITPSLIFLLSCIASGAQAADGLPQNCVQIRERIQAVTGLVPTPNMDLLKQIAMSQECNFSSAEVYRAAYGDKPLPQQESRDHHRSREQDDD